MQTFESLLSKISQALEKEGIPYMVIGGQAVLLHGEPRFTGDIDITVGIDTNEMQRVLNVIREISLEPTKDSTEDFVKRNFVLRAEDPKTGIGVDFIFSCLPYERLAIQRAVSVHIGTARIQFATAEDTIIHKLFAGRPRDIEDVKGIVNNKSDLDATYLKQWLTEFSSVTGRNLLREYDTIEAEVRG